MKRITISLILALVLVTIAISPVIAAENRNYVSHLSGNAAGVDTLAQGQAIFNFSKDGAGVSYKLIVANIENVTMAHIHIAPAPGQNGPPAVWLYPSTPPPVLIPGVTNGVLAMGTFDPSDFVGPLAGESLDDLKAAIAEGRAYVNVHTTQYPAGEIRGDIK